MPGPVKSIVQKSVSKVEPQIKFTNKPTVAFNEIKLKTSFSLNEITASKNSKTTNGSQRTENNISSTSVEISFDQVKNALTEFADAKQQQGAKQLFITLTTSALTYENQLITITTGNETQREQLMNMKQELVDQLRKILKTNSINLEIAISQSEVQTKVYKPNDVYKSMIEKNPALAEMKKRFDLEIDY